MQTPAEKYLVTQCVLLLGERNHDQQALRILNIGAGTSLSIEDQMESAGAKFICDRVDLDDCSVEHTAVENYYHCSVESMSPVITNSYVLSFANFVLEHVQRTEKAASEIYRVLEPGGHFVASVPNPSSIEFFLSKHTPLWFHRIIRGKSAWKTYYAYKDVTDLINIFERSGFRFVEARYYSFVEGYLHRFFMIGSLAKLYDKTVGVLKIRRLMGQACIVFAKPSR